MADAGVLLDNRLLAALPAPTLENVAPRITLRKATRGQIVYRPGEPMASVTFPLSALFSLVVTDPLGSFTSIATVPNVDLPVHGRLVRRLRAGVGLPSAAPPSRRGWRGVC